MKGKDPLVNIVMMISRKLPGFRHVPKKIHNENHNDPLPNKLTGKTPGKMGGLNLRILSLFRKARNFQGEAIHIHNYIHPLLIPQIGKVVPFAHKVQHA